MGAIWKPRMLTRGKGKCTTTMKSSANESGVIPCGSKHHSIPTARFVWSMLIDTFVGHDIHWHRFVWRCLSAALNDNVFPTTNEYYCSCLCFFIEGWWPRCARVPPVQCWSAAHQLRGSAESFSQGVWHSRRLPHPVSSWGSCWSGVLSTSSVWLGSGGCFCGVISESALSFSAVFNHISFHTELLIRIYACAYTLCPLSRLLTNGIWWVFLHLIMQVM